MELTVQYLRDQAIQMEHTLSHKGMDSPDCEVIVNYSTYTAVLIKIYFNAQGEGELEYFKAEEIKDVPNALSAAWAYIRDLKSAEELRRQAFMKKFGNMLDEAREIGLDVDFLNPLEEAMKKLSTNILEAPKPQYETPSAAEEDGIDF